VASLGGSPPLRTHRDQILSFAEHFSSPKKEGGGCSTNRADEMPLQI